MEKIVNTQTSIFNENKSDNKIVKITFMFLAMIFASLQSEAFAADVKDPNLVVPVVCADGNSNQKYEQCANSCNNVSGNQVSERKCHLACIGSNCSNSCSGSYIYQYTAINIVGVSFTQTCSGKGSCRSLGLNDYDEKVRNAVINKCKISCEIFKNQCSSYVVRIMDLMSAMPEIGISRVDPNLIEY